jgi:hypothetical protein
MGSRLSPICEGLEMRVLEPARLFVGRSLQLTIAVLSFE